MDLNINSAEKTAVLTLGGEVTIENVGALKEALISAKQQADHVLVRLEQVTRMDLSVFQILCSAHLSIVGPDSTFELDTGETDILRRFAERIGCSNEDGAVII